MSDLYADFLAEKGISLSSLGIEGCALERQDALIAIQILGKLSLPILGGDVYFMHNARIEPAYCNWYVEQTEGESVEDFATRSFEHTRRYIERFPESLEKVALFVLVTRDR